MEEDGKKLLRIEINVIEIKSSIENINKLKVGFVKSVKYIIFW